MNNLLIEATDSSLFINFDAETDQLLFKGESRPENCTVFFKPVFNWLNEYKKSLAISPINKNVIVNFHLDYFNSTSAKFLTDIFLILKEIQSMKNVDLTTNWHYKSIDEEIMESGEDFKEMTGVNVVFVSFD